MRSAASLTLAVPVTVSSIRPAVGLRPWYMPVFRFRTTVSATKLRWTTCCGSRTWELSSSSALMVIQWSWLLGALADREREATPPGGPRHREQDRFTRSQPRPGQPAPVARYRGYSQQPPFPPQRPADRRARSARVLDHGCAGSSGNAS